MIWTNNDPKSYFDLPIMKVTAIITAVYKLSSDKENRDA